MTISQPKGYSMFCAKDKPEPDYKAHAQRLADAEKESTADADALEALDQLEQLEGGE